MMNSGGDDAAIGGWQWSGLTRWTSGLPFSVLDQDGQRTGTFRAMAYEPAL
ncbi:hypothetical protein H7849_15100 [Alloacidobacterium dinghuense]|uniref:Uncharacterized protein n=1 Tax=Alloacidobacterium dinghuense TaxID=2763107 RepID=A0A7G8BD57_9BACT|nr:hypothetical protein [Alloacidobacterium dinghuense]QNI30477.1 hypothetical protein H7849_15100 [Alloacidobacterium dinghuense]